MKAKIITIALMLVLFAGLAQAEITCTTKNTNCTGTETEVIRLSDTTNAHGAIAGTTVYSQRVCCSGIGVVSDGASCLAGQKILGLSDITNAHAEAPTQTNYSTSICASGVQSVSVRNSCQVTEVCLVALSDTTNAHLEECNTGNYTNKICISDTSGAGTGSLRIPEVAVGNPSYIEDGINITVSVLNTTINVAGKESEPTASLAGEETKKAMLANVSGTIRVEIASTTPPMKTLPTKTVTSEFNQRLTPVGISYSNAEITGAELTPGIYTITTTMLESSNEVDRKTTSFALVNRARTISIPETNLLGAIIAASGVFVIVFVFGRREQ